MPKFDSYKSSAGFTLVELLVTVAVMGIMSSMAVAQFQSFRERAHDLSAITAGRDAVLAIEAYMISAKWDPHSLTEYSFEVNASGNGSRGWINDTYVPDNYGSSTFLPGYVHQKGVHFSIVLYLSSTYAYGIYTGNCKGTPSANPSDGNAKTVYELTGGKIHKYNGASWIVPGSWACS